MKKPVKIALIVCCAAFFLFLLLPFLETPAPKTAAKNETAKAEPQIFTSNPLTELVGRIARFFRTRQNAEEKQKNAGRMTADQADELFGEPQGDTMYASAQSAGAGTGVFSGGDGAAYADAYLQTEEGDWVLIRQTSPEGSTRGMHEINVKDNAFDRFVTQERQARFTPVMRLPAVKEEVPDSRLARVFNPIKRLFGFGEKPAAQGAVQGTGDDDRLASARTSSSAGMGKNTDKSSTLQKSRPVDWDGFRNNPFASLVPGSAEAAEAFLNLINPARAIAESAEWLAKIKYPDPNSPEREQAEKEIENRAMQKFSQDMNEIMKQQNGDQEPINVFQGAVNPFSCGDGSVKKETCSETGQEEDGPDIAAIKARSNVQFFEQTGHHLPPAGITVVLNATDMPILSENVTQEDLESIDETKLQELEFYQFMRKECTDNCYWVATGTDNSSELAKTVEAVGLTLKGDPLQRYDQYARDYIEEKRQEGALSDEDLRALEQRLTENKTPYTAYSMENMNQLFQNTMDLIDQRAKPEDGTVPFFSHVENAYDFQQRSDQQFPILYGRGSAVDGDKQLEQRADDFTQELAQYVNNAKEILHNIKKEHSQEGAQEMAKPKIQQMQEQFKREMQNFSKNNDLGTYQK
ncbi:MAG: hypothetical protein J6J74_00060 [Elusimicrobiaceae bacterium]|nr:hypothetical protein [Elusimicrobiaceae bacterium]